VAIRVVARNVSIGERVAAGNISVAVEIDVTAMPIRSPVSPAPAVAAESPTYQSSDTEGKRRSCCGIPAGITGVSRIRSAIDYGGTILRHIHDFGVRRLNLDRLSLCRDGLLRSTLQISGVLGLGTECLDGLHHSLRLVDVGFAESG